MSFEPKQIQMICLEDLVLENHIYRKFLSLWNMDSVRLELEKLEAESDHKGYGIYQIFLCLLLQSVDMQSGMINKVAITSANIIDSKGFKHVAPSQGAVYADKGYCDKNAKITAQTKNIHLAAVKKNNMKNKNRDLDSYYTKLRSPFEHVFSKQNKRVRYKGIAKNQFTAFMQAITFNFKRLVVLAASPPLLAT